MTDPSFLWSRFLTATIFWVLCTALAYTVSDVIVSLYDIQADVTLVQDTLLAEAAQPGHTARAWPAMRNKLEQYLFFTTQDEEAHNSFTALPAALRRFSTIHGQNQADDQPPSFCTQFCHFFEFHKSTIWLSASVWAMSGLLMYFTWSSKPSDNDEATGKGLFDWFLYGCIIVMICVAAYLFWYSAQNDQITLTDKALQDLIAPAVMVVVLALEAIWANNDAVVYLLLSVMLPVWAWANGVRRTFPKVFGPQYYLFVSVAATVFVALMGTSALNKTELFLPNLHPLPNKTDANWTYMYDGSKDQRPPYPICLLRWGHTKHSVSTIDLAILSAFAYGSDSAFDAGGEVHASTRETFSNPEVSACVVKHQKYFQVGRVVATRFVHSSNSECKHASLVAGTTVIAIKGSSQPFDIYVDLTMWAMISVFQGTTAFMPLLEQIPNWFFANLLCLFPKWNEKYIFSNLENVHRNLTKKFPNDRFVITGHSLGGGIAIAAGGRLNVSAIGFSGPGSHFSRWRFGTTMEKAYRNSVNVAPDSDPVPKFDRHDEIVQYIECKDTTKKIEAGENYPDRPPYECHFLDTTICELWRACGDDKGRNFSQRCSKKVDPETKGRYLTGSFNREVWSNG